MSVKTLIYSLSLIQVLSACKSSSNEPTEQEIRIQYVNKYTREISIDPGNSDFSDLQDLGDAIGNAKIVMLGEATHGEGNIFLAKTRIIEYLVTQKEFEVIAFESPLYDLYKANLNIKDGSDSYTSIEKAIYSVWTKSNEFKPFINLLDNYIPNGIVEIAGVDSDFFYPVFRISCSGS